MASISRVGKKYRVRWRELSVVVDAAGVAQREWKWREKRAPDRATAQRLAREVEQAAALGEAWHEQREQPVVTLGRIALDYVAAAVADPATPEATAKFRASMLSAALKWAGEETPASELGVRFLREFADSLPGEGRKAVTRHRKVRELEFAWAWAFDDPETYPGVPIPRRVTDRRRPSSVRQPVPVVALARPTWADLDATVHALRRSRAAWHGRLGTLLRYTGLRGGQALSLRWEDVDLERAVLWCRAGVSGAKRGRGRALPMHAALVAGMAGWGVRSGFVFSMEDGRKFPVARPNRPFRAAWKKAGVDPAKWDAADDPDVPGARAQGRPTHGFRAGVMGELMAAGAPLERVEYLVGHARGSTIAAYLPEADPESVPVWAMLVEDVARIPEIGEPEQAVVEAGDGLAAAR